MLVVSGPIWAPQGHTLLRGIHFWITLCMQENGSAACGFFFKWTFYFLGRLRWWLHVVQWCPSLLGSVWSFGLPTILPAGALSSLSLLSLSLLRSARSRCSSVARATSATQNILSDSPGIDGSPDSRVGRSKTRYHTMMASHMAHGGWYDMHW